MQSLQIKFLIVKIIITYCRLVIVLIQTLTDINLLKITIKTNIRAIHFNYKISAGKGLQFNNNNECNHYKIANMFRIRLILEII